MSRIPNGVGGLNTAAHPRPHWQKTDNFFSYLSRLNLLPCGPWRNGSGTIHIPLGSWKWWAMWLCHGGSPGVLELDTAILDGLPPWLAAETADPNLEEPVEPNPAWTLLGCALDDGELARWWHWWLACWLLLGLGALLHGLGGLHGLLGGLGLGLLHGACLHGLHGQLGTGGFHGLDHLHGLIRGEDNCGYSMVTAHVY